MHIGWIITPTRAYGDFYELTFAPVTNSPNKRWPDNTQRPAWCIRILDKNNHCDSPVYFNTLDDANGWLNHLGLTVNENGFVVRNRVGESITYGVAPVHFDNCN